MSSANGSADAQKAAYAKQMAQKKAQLSNARAAQASARAKADEIGRVYERLARDKCEVMEHRSACQRFKDKKYSRFEGNLQSNTHCPAVQGLVEAYNGVVDRIDAAMDELNLERMRLENEAYSYNPVIGSLQSAINALAHLIQNLVN